ncbi:hypothetical protein ACFWA5_34990 [Streptomyces mirabilis]|uniref:hypothetical protein n=1 Tax=Streptomyces mirabilis TaxID=68239 RepID=UPI00331CFF99
MTLGTTGRAPHKSALLNHLQTMADGDFEIMRSDAVESEAELGFAALQQLPRPHLTQLPKPPDPRDRHRRRILHLTGRAGKQQANSWASWRR